MKLTTVRKLNKYISVTSILVVLTLLVSVSLMGFLGAKYVKEIPFSGNVTITANLANSFTLLESKANMQDSGLYVLDTENKVSSNEYMVLPGVNIPKDPKITIVGKTNVEAYLYIEVVENLGEGMSYQLSENWLEVTGANVQNEGAKLYVYTEGGSPKIFAGTDDDGEISLIKGDIITVPSSFKMSATDIYSLDFYASLLQKVDDDPAINYNENNKVTN